MKIIGQIAVTLILICLFITSAQAAEWGEIRQATVNLNVRAARDSKGKHVVTLHKGDKVKCDFLKAGWFAIFKMDETERSEKNALGFANAKFLKLVDVPKPEAEVTSPPASAKTEVVKAQNPAQVVNKTEGEGELKGAVAESAPPDPIKIGVDPGKLPVQITSDRMTYDESGKVVTFKGNVVAKHGELTLWADTLSAFFGSKSGKKFSVDSVDRIVAQGNVRAKKGKTEGECQKVTYYVEKQLLTMEGDPILSDGPNSLTGGTINFYVHENRSEVIRGKDKRVKAIFLTPARIKEQ